MLETSLGGLKHGGLAKPNNWDSVLDISRIT